MSAHLDESQPIAFYFGNAAKDLAHLLPPDDYRKPTTDIAQLSALFDRATEQLNALTEQRREISFLIGDLKRMIS